MNRKESPAQATAGKPEEGALVRRDAMPAAGGQFIDRAQEIAMGHATVQVPGYAGIVGADGQPRHGVRGAHIPATFMHDAGAYARCSYCGRYTDNPKVLSSNGWPCECGTWYGWSGSFAAPTADSTWNDGREPFATGQGNGVLDPTSPHAAAEDDTRSARSDDTAPAPVAPHSELGQDDDCIRRDMERQIYDREGLNAAGQVDSPIAPDVLTGFPRKVIYSAPRAPVAPELTREEISSIEAELVNSNGDDKYPAAFCNRVVSLCDMALASIDLREHTTNQDGFIAQLQALSKGQAKRIAELEHKEQTARKLLIQRDRLSYERQERIADLERACREKDAVINLARSAK